MTERLMDGNDGHSFHALQARTEVLAERELRYRTLFSRIDQGFCVCAMLLDEQQAPVDYRFIEINDAFLTMTGLPADASEVRAVHDAIADRGNASPGASDTQWPRASRSASRGWSVATTSRPPRCMGMADHVTRLAAASAQALRTSR